MNEVNIFPCAKSVTTQLAELKRHELRRNNAKRSSEEHFSALMLSFRRLDRLNRSPAVYKWKQLNRCSV